MLEGTDAKIHLVHYTPEMEQARHRGSLRTNQFVSLRRTVRDEEATLEIEDFGNAEDALTEGRLIAARARRLVKRGIVPTEDGWGGWLGRYQAEVRKSALDLAREAERLEQTKLQRRKRERDRSRGR